MQFSRASSLDMSGNAAVTWTPAMNKGKKKTVNTWERIAAFTSLWCMPTFFIIENRNLSSYPSEICL